MPHLQAAGAALVVGGIGYLSNQLLFGWSSFAESDRLPFAQTWFGLYAVMVGSGFGFYAIREFVQKQAQAKLRLTLTYDGPMTTPAGAPMHLVYLNIENFGDAPAKNFEFSVTLPFIQRDLRDPLNPKRPTRIIMPILGKDLEGDSWKLWNQWRRDGGPLLLVFRSEGTVTIHESAAMCQILLPIGSYLGDQSATYECEVRLSCDGKTQEQKSITLDFLTLTPGLSW